jgi:hypothetical protein
MSGRGWSVSLLRYLIVAGIMSKSWLSGGRYVLLWDSVHRSAVQSTSISVFDIRVFQTRANVAEQENDQHLTKLAAFEQRCRLCGMISG